MSIRSDHVEEFENQRFETFCENHGISYNFSFPKTPQQNRMVEKKKRKSQDMAKTMLCENNIPKYFWLKQ